MKSLPVRFEETMRLQLGNEYPSFLSSLQEPPPVSVRRHAIKNRDVVSRQPVPWCDSGVYLETRPVFTLDPLLHAGSYYVQEASSMFLEQALKQTADLHQPLNVIDLCAAPGGKSTHLLSLLSRESLLVSNDVIRSRASILSENIQKWGYPNAIVTNNDASDFQKLNGFFDVMVIDAPCSGEGLFRKDPGAIEEWSPENVRLCSARQKRIVSDVWGALRENGILIYSTCTYNQVENEDNLRWLRENHHVEFEKIVIDPSWGVEEVRNENVIGYRFYPHRAKGEGLFVSVIRKTGNSEAHRIKNKNILTPPAKKIQERLREWIMPSMPVTFFQFKDLLFLAPESKAKEVEFLLQHFKIMYAGTNLATLKHDKLIPDHALALSVELRKENFLMAEVTESEAIKYLRKDVIRLDTSPVGFTLVTYQNMPLGWANVLSNRVNNMYPSDWRIRMAEKL